METIFKGVLRHALLLHTKSSKITEYILRPKLRGLTAFETGSEMMRVTILSVGKLKERYLTEGVKEYLKRMGPYAKVEVEEVPDEHCPDNAPPAIIEQVKQKEAERLLKRLRPGTYLIVMDARGKMLSSEELAAKVNDLALSGKSDITFVIGGSQGLAASLVNQADLLLSLSKLTFPHQVVRLILLEQIYRSFKIIKNEPYHK